MKPVLLLFLGGCAIPELRAPDFPNNPTHDYDNDGFTEADGDCDDLDATIHPDALEICDDIDNDCDDRVDDADDDIDPASQSYEYADIDGDGYGSEERLFLTCTPGGDPLMSQEPGDCDDDDADVSPAAAEICGNGIDDNCSGGPDDCGWDTEVSLTEADVTFVGAWREDTTGLKLSATHDLTGDARPDLVVSAPRLDAVEGDINHGAIYVQPGNVLDQSEWTLPEESLVIVGEHEKARLGWGLATVDDRDGDGFAELLAGAPGNPATNAAAGAVYLFAGPITAGASTADADGAWLGTDTDEYFGPAIVEAGNLGGWGRQGLLVAHQDADMAGVLYLFEGLPEGELDGPSNAIAVLEGPHADASMGIHKPAVTDLDGDGIDDLVVGAAGYEYYDKEYGALMVMYGPLTGTVDADTRADAIFVGGTIGAAFGSAVAAGGDIDGDGLPDVLVSAESHDLEEASDVGRLHVFTHESAQLDGSPQGTVSAPSAAAVAIQGFEEGSLCGISAEFIGDFNGDGQVDIAVGAMGDTAGLGSAGVFLGPMESTGSLVDFADADHRFTQVHPSSDTGWAVAGYPDLDLDGDDELLITAPNLGGDETAGRGEVYLLLGALGS